MIPKPISRAEEQKEKRQERTAKRQKVYRYVSQRDNYKCRAYGYRIDPKATSLLQRGHHHHIQYRSKGGNDTTENVVLLSAEAHADVHAGRLFIDGNANKLLRFENNLGEVWHR